jgi:hypothetical protein
LASREGRLRSDDTHHLHHHPLHQVDDVLFLNETHLEVELSELRLPVGPEVLVAEAPRNLEIALKPRHHQYLFELLRRLWQRVELAGVDPARHQIVARSFGRALDEDRRLNLKEPLPVQEIAYALHQTVPQKQVRLQTRPPQIEIPVFQHQVLVDLHIFVDVERRRWTVVQYLSAGDHHLNGSGLDLRVLGSDGAGHNLSGDTQHILGTKCMDDLIPAGGALRVEDNLDDACTVTEVDEHQSTVVAPPVYPPG